MHGVMVTTETIDTTTLHRLETGYRANVERVHGYVHHRVGPGDAMDVVAETFHAAALAARDGRIDQVTTAWLMAVARNKVADHWRRAYRAKAWRAHTHLRPSEAVMFPVDWHEDPRRPAVIAALDRLRPRDRALLVFHHVDGMSVAELADLLTLSVSATESALARARQAFRRLYDGGGL